MKLRRMLLLLLVMTMLIPSAVVFARPTPVNQIHAGMFPVGSRQRVEYASALNVRRGPGTRYAVFTHITRGTYVEVLEFRNSWIRINTTQGEGWVFTGYLSRDVAAAPPLTGTGTAGGTGGTVAATDRTPQHLLRADLFPNNSQARVDFASHVNIRRGPGNNYAVLTTLARGTNITILEYRQMWVRLNTAQGDGWIFSGFLSNDAVIAARGGGGQVSAPGLGARTPHAQLRAENFPNGSQQTVDYAHFLNVRRGPGTGHAAFTHLARGATVTVLEFRYGWVRISTAHGYGWIYAAYLRR